MSRFRLLPVLMAIVVLTACATAPTERIIPADGSASVYVLNRSQAGFTIYVLSNVGRHRLGFVDALGSGRFRIPGQIVAAGGTYRMYAEGRGAYGDVGSELFQLQPGFIVNWRVPDNNLSVR